jgi:hypothetical protein
MPEIKAKNIHQFIEPYVVTSGKNFRFKDHDPADTHRLNSEDIKEARKQLERE